MTYKLHLGDCVETMQGMNAGSIDLTVTSPPYDNLREYKGFNFDFETTARQLFRVTKAGGVVVWVVGDSTVNGSESLTSFRQAIYFKDVCGFNIHDTMIYKTDKPPMNDNRYHASFEFMFILSKGKPKKFNPIMVKTNYPGSINNGHFRMRDRSLKPAYHNKPTGEKKIKGNVWDIDSGYMKTTTDKYAFEHPAMFPEALARDHILSWSDPGDLVFDPFLGSGTTGKMAIAYQRNFIGVEISSEYLAIAEKRIKQASMQEVMFK